MNFLSRLARGVVPETILKSRLVTIAAHMVRPHNSIYNQQYFDEVVEVSAVQSAAVMAKSIVEHFHPNSVIDVGCGTGALLQAFGELGCKVQGLEYSDAAISYCRKRGIPVKKFKIGKDHYGNSEYDAAVSFEVAEHLPGWVADRYVHLLCSLAPLVIMSAAPPGQSGTDHINEQPRSYWIEKFVERGYYFDLHSSAWLSSEWSAAAAASWYSNNVLVLRR